MRESVEAGLLETICQHLGTANPPPLVEMKLEAADEACATRNNSLEVRDLRPYATRSGRLRKGTTNKTTQWAPADPDEPAEDEEWPEDIVEAMRAIVGDANLRHFLPRSMSRRFVARVQ